MKALVTLTLLCGALYFADVAQVHADTGVPSAEASDIEVSDGSGNDFDPGLANGITAGIEDNTQRKRETTASQPCRATVTLTDGSIFNGSISRDNVPAKSETLGSFILDLSKVESIAFNPKHTEIQHAVPLPARISFRNGDVVTAMLAPEEDAFILDTILGHISIPIASIVSISLKSSGDQSDGASRLLYHCTFDSPAAIAHPAAGVARQQTAGRYLHALSEAGILREIPSGREKLYLNHRLLRVLCDGADDWEPFNVPSA